MKCLFQKLSTARLVYCLGAAASVVMFSGCASHDYCSKPQAYQSAPSVPPIRSAGALEIKPSPNALLIPPAPVDPVPFGRKVSDPKKPGATTWSCLDEPPPFTPSKLSTSHPKSDKPS